MIETCLAYFLQEDIGQGDISAAILPNQPSVAEITLKEPGVLYGFKEAETLTQLFIKHYGQNRPIDIHWLVEPCQWLDAPRLIARLEGMSQDLLTLERSLLNLLQTLSGTATITAQLRQKMGQTATKLLDTRKTLPGLRHLQKKAVHCGGGHNHRMGQYDMYHIKENHNKAAGGLEKAVEKAKAQKPNIPIEVEVENLAELKIALGLLVDRIMLDNLSPEAAKAAVALRNEWAPQIPLEISGNIDENNIHHYAQLGADYISMGALTKNVRALDLSLRLVNK